MKKIHFITILCFIAFFAKAQSSNTITIGEKITIFSKKLNENRKIWVYTPKITSYEIITSKKYPVLYVLDGEAHFFSTVGIIQHLSQANGNGILPEMIIVAIENTNRLRDFTPAMKKNDYEYQPNSFVKFLSDELIPYIDANYSTSPYKLLVGHSLGGLTVIDILTNFPSLFNAYIAIEPSMWYKDELYLKNTITQLQYKSLKGKKLFIGIANTMPKGFRLSKVRKDKSNETQHIRSLLQLDDFLKTNKVELQYAQKFYEKENHNSVPLLSEYDGLRFIFDFFHFQATEKDFTDSTSQIAKKLKTHYDKVSSEMGYRVAAPESFINFLAYEALGKKYFEKAKALFELNIENYPSSNNAYVALGDYYASRNDTNNAIEIYKKALTIKKDVAIEVKLNALSKQNTFKISPKELQKYTGTYSLDLLKINIILKVKEDKLWAIVPDQSDDEFVPLSKDVFTVKGKQGYTITFEMKDNKPISFTSVQPNGTFKASYVHE